MDMKYHTRFPVYIQQNCVDNETEEGEVDDVSDTEDADSPPSSPKKSLPLPRPKTLSTFPNFVASQQNQVNLRREHEVSRPYAVPQGGQFLGVGSIRPPTAIVAAAAPIPQEISCPPQNANAQAHSTQYKVAYTKKSVPCLPTPQFSLADNSNDSSHVGDLQGVQISQNPTESSGGEDPFDGFHDLEKMQLRMQLEELESAKLNTPVPTGYMDGGFVGALPPFGSGLETSDQAQMVAQMWFPAAPPPLIGVAGVSQKQIQRMHQLYHKACRLYDRAVAKLSAGGGARIDLASLPQPPSFPKLFAHNNPVTSPTASSEPELESKPAGLAVSSTGAGTVTGTVTNTTPKPLPVAAAAVHSPEVYSAAYASAYRQTMTVMPKPGDGGPPPNTPEYTALWRCYLDYYLQYYIQHHQSSSAASNASQLSTSAETPTTTTTTAWSTSNGLDYSSPQLAKRIRLASGGDAEGQSSSVTSNSLFSAGISQSGTLAPGVPVKAEVIKATKALLEPGGASEDGVETSKCVWISNLPTGVRAVDVKERCTPFGRVQTIKIIGSRKSKTPSIFAYLIMETMEAAVRLVEGLQGQTFQDKEIKVKRINPLPIS